MSRYHIFSPSDAIDYARRHGPGLGTELSAEEVGDGNLNQVFRVVDEESGRSVIVKQALPYIRCVGESWPLTRERARIEAGVLLQHGRCCPEHTVALLHQDAGLSVLLLEDLSAWRLWRQALLEGNAPAGAAARLGHYLARVLYHGSDFGLASTAKRAEVARFSNPELCATTEAVFFDDPYRDHQRNNIAPGLRPLAGQLWRDGALKRRVAALKHRFLCDAQALLHGDLHTGSVFITEDELKVFDAEFGFYGPMGFDLGSAIGNLLLNLCGQPGLNPGEKGRAEQWRRLEEVLTLWRVFHDEFTALATGCADPALAEPSYVEEFLVQVWRDSLGYAGTELIRRTIGIAHVTDLDGIDDAGLRLDCQQNALRLGRELILGAETCADGNALRALLAAYGTAPRADR
ncbi:S-methyl-5-thioribose kinase [Zobellella endophytica]|uniref:S-methyl-5-thioribose kinase n=1 Tax=Zobellella endophytica TaxID=2116700 RepID=A0A2P7RCR7_9GAMM|nr:S-methyl-5-thioribose kinase [Zobellella endophytica]PSJ47999.1 S-methyl-5-thioribose kinase [Zobellella endophytica]